MEVSFRQFQELIIAQRDLEIIREIAKSGVGYCSNDIELILGIHRKKENSLSDITGDANGTN